MAKNKKRAVPADLWLDRATAAQVEKMKAALHLIPPVPAEAPRPPTVPMQPPFDIEGHIAGLKWSQEATDYEKTLVAGNLRHLAALMVQAPIRAVPLHPVPVLDNALPEGQRLVSWGVDDLGFDTAYVLERVKPVVDGGVPSYRLLKLRIERGVVVHIEAGVENLREIILQDIEDHILRDA